MRAASAAVVLAANPITATLVTTGAVYGLPMSTTHVSSDGIMGIGAGRGSLNWTTVRGMASSPYALARVALS